MGVPKLAVGMGLAVCLAAGSVASARDVEPLPRHATAEEAAWEAANSAWRFMDRGPSIAPTGPVVCPGEYAPCDGVILSYFTGYGTAIMTIVREMAVRITTTGQARAYIVFSSETSRNTNLPIIAAAGADMSRVVPVVESLNSIWMRDYGPRYIYEGEVRAIVDHTYNRPTRATDDGFPSRFALVKRHGRYVIPLIHGGGNHHLNSIGESWATRLVANENPQLGGTTAAREAGVRALWAQYQNIQTTITDPFPTSYDATQHIDMWMQIIGDRTVMISEWPAPAAGGTPTEPRRITELVAATMSAPDFPGGPWTVHRVPARLVGGTHYTYTNVVMCNDLVLVPSYTQSSVAPLNAPALAAWQAAAPGKTVVQVNCEAIVTLAGVMHCIAMHVPKHAGDDDGSGNLAPTALVKSPNGGAGESFTPGSTMDIRWLSDDDNAVANVDVEVSLDGGVTWPVMIAAATTDDGQQSWVVPNYWTREARVRVTARDAGLASPPLPARIGSDTSDSSFSIAGTCRADFNNSLDLSVEDLFAFLAAFFGEDLRADFDDSGAVSVQDLFEFLGAYFAGCA